MVIDLNALSWSSLKQELINFVKSKPSYATFKDFYDCSLGFTFIELLAAYGTFERYQTGISRRETYLQYAQNYSSLLAGSESLGYSAFRGKNPTLKLQFTPDVTTIINEWDLVGTIQGEGVESLENKAVNLGVPTTLNVILGTINEESIVIDSSDLRVFRFTSTDISETYKLYLNDVEIPSSSRVLDLNDDKYVVLSNGVNGVDVFYLNGGAYSYDIGDILKIRYISLKDYDYKTNNISLLYGEITGITTLTAYGAKQSKDSIRTNSPVYHETQNVIRGRLDFQKLLLLHLNRIVGVSCKDVSPAVVDVTCVTEDYTVLNATEKTDFLNFLYGISPFGRLPCLLSDSFMNRIHLKVDLTVYPNIPAPNIISDVTKIISEFENILKLTIDLYEIEHRIEKNLDYIKVARARVGTNFWSSETFYCKGAFISITANNDLVFRLSRTKNYSGTAQPTWNTTYNELTMDNEILWRTEPIKVNPDIWGGLPTVWTASTDYKINDTVKVISEPNLMFRCIGFRRKSHATIEPTWGTELKSFTVDNKLLWVAIEEDGTLPVWVADTFYTVGDKINPTTSTGVSYSCVEVGDFSDTIEPAWDTTIGHTTDDNKLVWECLSANQVLFNMAWNEYICFEKDIKVF